MKKGVFLVLLASLCLILLSSCLTAMAIASLSSNNYSSTTYMTKQTGFNIDKSKKVIVLFVDDNFQWQRAGEEALYNALSREGFSDVILFSDYGRYKDYNSTSRKNIYDVIDTLDADYFIYSGVYDDFYTFHYGGEIARISFESNLLPLKGINAYEYVIEATTYTEASDNNMVGYTKSLEDALYSFSRSFVDKLTD